MLIVTVGAASAAPTVLRRHPVLNPDLAIRHGLRTTPIGRILDEAFPARIANLFPTLKLLPC